MKKNKTPPSFFFAVDMSNQQVLETASGFTGTKDEMLSLVQGTAFEEYESPKFGLDIVREENQQTDIVARTTDGNTIGKYRLIECPPFSEDK